MGFMGDPSSAEMELDPEEQQGFASERSCIWSENEEEVLRADITLVQTRSAAGVMKARQIEVTAVRSTNSSLYNDEWESVQSMRSHQKEQFNGSTSVTIDLDRNTCFDFVLTHVTCEMLGNGVLRLRLHHEKKKKPKKQGAGPGQSKKSFTTV